MNILIIGNILKDVYFRLDERLNKFEMDEKGTPWLDLSFDGSTHNFFRRSSIYGGAAVALEVLSRFGLDSHIAGARLGFVDGEIVPNGQTATEYRYMLCHGNKITYFIPNDRVETVWSNPEGAAVDWIFVDRSAHINPKLVQDLKNYLTMSSHTRVAFYAPKELSDADKELITLADMLFVDEKLNGAEFKGSVCEISENLIRLGEVSQTWRIERTDLMTHLTTHSIIAASIFASLLHGKSVREALLLAKVNVENSTLAGSVALEKLENLAKTQDESDSDIHLLAAQLMAPEKGILAADESADSIRKKFEAVGIPDDEQHRRDFRNLLISTPELERYISGVILFDETTHQKSDDGRDFVAYLTAHGIIPGIKVDTGLVPLNEDGALPGETITSGLDGLEARLEKYYQSGLRFAKWRAAFNVTATTPSEIAVVKNAEVMARYAKACQNAGLVPIVEPEVVYDGNYTIEQCADVSRKVLDAVFDELAKSNVHLDACILKTNMILAGKQYPIQSSPEEVGRFTAEVLRAHVPEGLSGVVFLSGGQDVEQATENLRAVVSAGPYPWPLTFSFSRALEDPALRVWAGDNLNLDKAKTEFKRRLIANTEAI